MKIPRKLYRRPLPPKFTQGRIRSELKPQTEPKVAKPAAKVVKTVSKAAKPASQLVFTSFAQPKVEKIDSKVVKVETKSAKSDQNKTEKVSAKVSKLKQPPTKPPPQVEPNADKFFELDSLTSRVLDSELQDVMVQIRQDLSDEPSSEAEVLVAEKYKNEAGEDLKNVLGMNVTKRLLNVFNPLFVKVEFNKKPDNVYLTKFIRACNCVAMKKFRSDDCTYVAQIRTVSDFDRICAVKRLKCGEARATVVPCYKFTQCPPKLKTVYYKENVQETKESGDKKTEQTDNNGLKNTENVASVAQNNTKTSQSYKDGEKQVNTTNSDKTLKKEDTIDNTNKQVDAKTPKKKDTKTPKKENTKTPIKEDIIDKIHKNEDAIDKTLQKEDTIDKTLQKEDTIERTPKKDDTIDKTPKKENKIDKTPKKEATTVKTPKKVDANNKSPEKLGTIDNTIKKRNTNGNALEKHVKTVALNTEPVKTPDAAEKPVTTNEPATASKAKESEAAKKTKAHKGTEKPITEKPTTANKLKAVTTAANKKQIASKIIKPNIVKKKELPAPNKEKTPPFDYDEMNDDDILTIVTDGIILDECSGSDVE